MRGLDPAPATAAVIDLLRQTIPGPGPDRFLSLDIEEAVVLVVSRAVVEAVETVTGQLR